MEQLLVNVAVAIVVAMLASWGFSWIQSKQRGVPATEQGLLVYIKQLEGEREELKTAISELKASNRAKDEDIKYREKERELFREERQNLNFKVELLKVQLEDLRRDVDVRGERSGGINASGNANLNIGRDAVGGNSARS